MRAFLLACFLALQMPIAFAGWSGVVEEVVSGDTLKVNYEGGLYNVRLYGVEAPKLNQPYGVTAREATSNLTLGRSVDVHRVYADGNTDVAIVYVHDQFSIQAYLTGAGLAWVYQAVCKYESCANWQSMQAQAKDAEHGLWASANPVPPWNWKASQTVKKKPVVRKKKPIKKLTKRSVVRQVQADKPIENAVIHPEMPKVQSQQSASPAVPAFIPKPVPAVAQPAH